MGIMNDTDGKVKDRYDHLHWPQYDRIHQGYVSIGMSDTREFS